MSETPRASMSEVSVAFNDPSGLGKPVSAQIDPEFNSRARQYRERMAELRKPLPPYHNGSGKLSRERLVQEYGADFRTRLDLDKEPLPSDKQALQTYLHTLSGKQIANGNLNHTQTTPLSEQEMADQYNSWADAAGWSSGIGRFYAEQAGKYQLMHDTAAISIGM